MTQPPPLVIHPEAVAEARAAFGWYEARNERAAQEFMAELDRAIEQVSGSPARWGSYLEGTRRFLLRRFPYAVIYREAEGVVRVVAVAHMRRNPGYWRSRDAE